LIQTTTAISLFSYNPAQIEISPGPNERPLLFCGINCLLKTMVMHGFCDSTKESQNHVTARKNQEFEQNLSSPDMVIPSSIKAKLISTPVL